MRTGARPLAAVALILCGLLLADEVDAKKRPRRKKSAATKSVRPNFDARLPLLGTKLVAFPALGARLVAAKSSLFAPAERNRVMSSTICSSPLRTFRTHFEFT